MAGAGPWWAGGGHGVQSKFGNTATRSWRGGYTALVGWTWMMLTLSGCCSTLNPTHPPVTLTLPERPRPTLVETLREMLPSIRWRVEGDMQLIPVRDMTLIIQRAVLEEEWMQLAEELSEASRE